MPDEATRSPEGRDPEVAAAMEDTEVRTADEQVKGLADAGGFGEVKTHPDSPWAALHPAVAEILQYFTYSHLPERLGTVSGAFHDLAMWLAFPPEDHEGDWLDGPELTVALRKLLEAKDAAVRARL